MLPTRCCTLYFTGGTERRVGRTLGGVSRFTRVFRYVRKPRAAWQPVSGRFRTQICFCNLFPVRNSRKGWESSRLRIRLARKSRPAYTSTWHRSWMAERKAEWKELVNKKEEEIGAEEKAEERNRRRRKRGGEDEDEESPLSTFTRVVT